MNQVHGAFALTAAFLLIVFSVMRGFRIRHRIQDEKFVKYNSPKLPGKDDFES